MEITPVTIYLIYLIDNIRSICKIGMVIGACLTVGSLIGWFVANIDPYPTKAADTFSRIAKIAFIVCISCTLIKASIPSGKVMVAMYVVPKIVNNESVHQLPGEILDFIRSYLKENTIKKD